MHAYDTMLLTSARFFDNATITLVRRHNYISSTIAVMNYKLNMTLGPGIVTRRPLILQLVYSPSLWKKNKKSESDGSGDESHEFEEVEPEEWGKFNHIKDKVRAKKCFILQYMNVKWNV